MMWWMVEEVMWGLAERNIAPQDVNQQIVLKVMKAKKMKSKSYNYSSQVCFMRITGVPPARLSSELDNLVKLVFSAIQAPFAKHAPSTCCTEFCSFWGVMGFFQIFQCSVGKEKSQLKT